MGKRKTMQELALANVAKELLAERIGMLSSAMGEDIVKSLVCGVYTDIKINTNKVLQELYDKATKASEDVTYKLLNNKIGVRFDYDRIAYKDEQGKVHSWDDSNGKWEKTTKRDYTTISITRLEELDAIVGGTIV